MTGNEIRNEGLKVLSEMLKVNTTLTSLGLWGEEEIKTRMLNRNKNILQQILLEMKEQKQ